MIYLQKIQRKKLVLNEISIVRKSSDYDFLKKLNSEFLLTSGNRSNKENPYIPALFEDISSSMKLTKSLLFKYKPESMKKLGFSSMFENLNVFEDILELGFIELSKSKRTQFATHLSEILTK